MSPWPCPSSPVKMMLMLLTSYSKGKGKVVLVGGVKCADSSLTSMSNLPATFPANFNMHFADTSLGMQRFETPRPQPFPEQNKQLFNQNKRLKL